jgi:hypothetical protein
MSDEEISVVQEKITDNPFVKLQQNFSSYYKIHKETANSSEYIAPKQLHLPRNAFGKKVNIFTSKQFVIICESSGLRHDNLFL